jgi:hypothetical protein
MPNTIPAADAGLPNLNRRSALARHGLGIAASAAMGTATIAASAETTAAPELLRLIQAHRSANAAYIKAKERHADAGEICATAPTHIPFSWETGKKMGSTHDLFKIVR